MSKFKPLACNCHGHSAEGSLDGGSLTKKLVKRAKELGRPSIALTDHGQMSSLATLWEECKKAGIMPIHGIEVYIDSPWDEKKVLKNGEVQIVTRHMTVLFKTQKAYDYFCKLTPVAHERAIIRYGDVKPVITLNELKEIGNDICLGSGCFGSAIAKTLMNSGPEAAEAVYQEVRGIVQPGCFFVEIMPHILDSTWVRPEIDHATKTIIKDGFFKPNDLDDCGVPTDHQKPVNQFMIEMGLKYKDKIVFSEDSHVSERNEKVIQDLRLGDNWRFSCSYSMEPTEVWAQAIQKQLPFVTDKMIEEWVDNSYALIENFKNYTFLTHKERVLLPTMESVYGYELKEKSSKQQLKELIQKHDRFPKDPEKAQVYLERLKMEIDVLTNNGYDFLPYFFTVEDACTALRKMGYFASPRGSAASSLLLYLLGISIVDPIEWNLPFSRFMNAGRIKGGSMADIDLDISVKEDAMAYLKNRYGHDRVAPISTSLTMKLKLAIRDVERQFFKKVRPETEEMLKLMPMIPTGVDDEKWLHGYEDETTGEYVKGYIELEETGSLLLKQYIENEKEIWNVVIRCLAIPKSKGKHASGVIITPGPISDFMPLTLVGEELATAYSMKPVEYIGAVKFDFLGLKTLESLTYSFKALKKEKGIEVPWECPPHDDRVFSEVINNGKHAGLFQISGKAVLPYLKKAPPKSVGDISNLIALCRPGALDAPAPDGSKTTAADFYIDVVKGKKEPYYIHPSLEPILGETKSILIYQEQLMSIVKMILDLDDMQADDWRRAVGKKDKKMMDKLCGELVEGCIKKGWTNEQADKLLKTIIASSRYSFNKSHAISYGYIGYIEAWWKLNYPEYYWLGKLTAFQDKTDKIIAYTEECRNMILQPCVINSHPHEWKTENGKLRAPLSTLKGVGVEAALKTQEVIKAGLEQGWEQELQETGALHFRWGQALLALSQKTEKKRAYNATTLLNMLYNGTFDIFLEEKSNYKNLPVLAEQVKKALDSKASGGSVKKGQTVSMSGIEDEVMLNIWRSENNAVHVYHFANIDKVKEALIEACFTEADADKDYIMTRAAEFKDNLKTDVSFPRIDLLYNWTESSKNADFCHKYMTKFKDEKPVRICAIVGMITAVNYKTSKNGNGYINLTINTGTETIPNINLFGKALDNYSKIVKNKLICMVTFEPNKWNSMYTPRVIKIIPFFEIK